MQSAALPTSAGCSLMSAGQDWDAIRVPVPLGLAAMSILGARCGAVLEDPLSPAVYFFVPCGTARQWSVKGTKPLGAGSNVAVPPLRSITGPGPHWRVCPGDDGWVTEADALRAALEDCMGSGEAMSA
jgi:hypothetical protein